jgi:phage shock protein PspC (stress-responsive transcriptional regulator)
MYEIVRELAPVFGAAVMLYFTLAIIKLVMEHKTRNRLIEKGLVDEKVKYLFFEKQPGEASTSLKWGIVLIGLGLAVLIGRLAPQYIRDEMTVAALFFLAGLGLVIYYFIARAMQKKNQNQ